MRRSKLSVWQAFLEARANRGKRWTFTILKWLINT